jgi:hypothetical protein
MPRRTQIGRGFGFASVRAVLMLLALVSLTGTPYTVLMPVMAATVLHGDAHALGALMAATRDCRGRGQLDGAPSAAERLDQEPARHHPPTEDLDGRGLHQDDGVGRHGEKARGSEPSPPRLRRFSCRSHRRVMAAPEARARMSRPAPAKGYEAGRRGGGVG